MVHGGGHCSGGGGYRGGGGYSANVYTTNYFSSPRRNYHGNGNHNDCSCCKPCCLAFTCISLKPKTRLKYMWTLIVSFSLIIGLAVGLGTYGKRSMDTSSSDMRQIRSGLSPRFCTGVKVTSSSYPLSVYMLPEKPVIQSKNLTSHSYHKYAALEANTYEYWGFYLLKGSYVTISACSKDNGIDYYLVKGEHNLHKWQDDNYCSSCFEIHKSTKDCFHGNSTFTHKIYSSDEYYFIWANHLHYRSSVTVTFHLNRATYDLSSAIHSCTDSHECLLYYSNEESRESVVIAVPDLDIDNVKIYSTCLRRDGVFIGIFFVMPLGIGICLSAVIYFAWFRRRLKQSSLPYSTLQTDVSYNTSAQYATFHQTSTPSAPPPSYSDPAPPSYEESMKPNRR